MLVPRETAMYIFLKKCQLSMTSLRFSKNLLNLSHLLLTAFFVEIRRQRVTGIALPDAGGAV